MALRLESPSRMCEWRGHIGGDTVNLTCLHGCPHAGTKQHKIGCRQAYRPVCLDLFARSSGEDWQIGRLAQRLPATDSAAVSPHVADSLYISVTLPGSKHVGVNKARMLCAKGR
jgi:hypothetical protein